MYWQKELISKRYASPAEAGTAQIRNVAPVVVLNLSPSQTVGHGFLIQGVTQNTQRLRDAAGDAGANSWRKVPGTRSINLAELTNHLDHPTPHPATAVRCNRPLYV